MRRVEKAWAHAGNSRKTIKDNLSRLWEDRLDAVTRSFGLRFFPFAHALARQEIALDRKVLADLAWTEPRTFRSLVEVAKSQASRDPAESVEPSKHVVLDTRDPLE